MALTPDPFHWDVEEVVEVLCEASSPWTKDHAALAGKVREECIDGKTLLTFDETCSRQELMECLGIRLARHKSSLAEKLVNLRACSPDYRAWHADFIKKKALASGVLPDLQMATTTAASGNAARPSPALETEPLSPTRATPYAPSHMGRSPGDAASERDAQVLHENLQGPISPANQPRVPDESVSAEPPLKRKRLQPVNIGQRPLKSLTPWEDQPQWAYLGDGKLSASFVKSSSGLMSSRLVDHGDGDFAATALPNRIPVGRRMAVNRIMKQFLRDNSRKEVSFRNGEVPMRSPSPSSDKVLELSDLPSEWDDDILREMEEDRREDEANKRLERFLSQDEIQAVLNQEIEHMTDRWRERKRNKLQRDAHRIWTTARREETKNHERFKARNRALECHERVQALSARILAEKWANEKEVRDQAQCLEQNLEGKLYHLWVIDTLESRHEPPKPHTVPRPRKQVRPPIDPMNEVLTSSDDDDFIVPDEAGGVQGEPMNGVEPSLSTPIKTPLEYVDLTQSAPRDGKKAKAYIDLTTPSRANSSVPKLQSKDGQLLEDIVPPSFDSLEPVEEICSADKNYWSDRQDRWRVVIYMLGRLSFGRRRGVFETMKSGSSDDVWQGSVVVFLSNPPQELSQLGQSEKETIDFDIACIFLSFIRCKVQAEKRMISPGDRSKKKLRDHGGPWFTTFCDFVRGSEPIFPQESQIYRTDAFDMELAEEDEEDLDNDGDKSAKGRKTAPREIVQNKDAVDLRQREQQRARDHEARRLKLRAVLATSGLVSQDKSRLIINESKEDYQALLYVDDEIGKTIKDHQVDGVRFLWNQIILDPECRQGCLLAHTMGLGKTMQVITFLVAIAEAAASPDATLRSQVPVDLQASQTLVLCPAGLVDNWMDELLKWVPRGCLGALSQLDATAKCDERLAIAKKWADSGGVLVVGYSMFIRLSEDEEMERLLLDKPNIVIADEAHMLKNPNGKLNRLSSQFKTTSRIALTGSPLANNVEEYFAMINWVAPNFLGPLAEFREVYVRDIQAGLWVDSMAWERRKALKMLQVLKDTVASKVHRATIKSCLAHDLPQKSEFVISVTPTSMQRMLYEMYLDGLGVPSEGQGSRAQKMVQTKIFQVVNDLSLICNHPRAFHQKVLEVQKEHTKHEAFPRDIIAKALRVTKGPENMEPSLSCKVQLLIMILDEARRLGDKVLVFSQSIFTLDYIESLLELQRRAVCRLDGKTRIDRRQEKIRDFNSGDQEVYLISTTAGGVGLNIQGANRVVIFDSKWNPVNDQQAVGRAYRLGQQKHVFVYHLMVAGSFEEAMQSKAVFKTQLASRVVDKKNPVAWGKRSASLTQHIKDVPGQDLGGFLGKDQVLDYLVEHPSDGCRITKIVSTETFEEEDVNTNLTPEERREAESLVHMNRLRRTDPAEYERVRDEQAREQNSRWVRAVTPLPYHGSDTLPAPGQPNHTLARLMSASKNTLGTSVNGETTRPLQASNSSNTDPSQAQAMHDVQGRQETANAQDNQASDNVATGMPRTLHPTDANSRFSTSSVTPFPMAGANTFFAQQAPTLATTTSSGSAAGVATPTPRGGSLFSQPQSPQKKEFEQKLAEMVSRLQDKDDAWVHGKPEDLAAAMTEEVHRIRKEKSLGFLPDNHQWRILCDVMDQERFIQAALAGYLTPNFLANADKKSLQQRIHALNGLSEEDFVEQMGKGCRERDPENLQNIRRSPARPERSPQAKEDEKVMREAADKRQQRRAFRLPSWAVENLAANAEGGNTRNGRPNEEKNTDGTT